MTIGSKKHGDNYREYESFIEPRKYADTYDEDKSRIEVDEYGDTYDENKSLIDSKFRRDTYNEYSSRITAMNQVIAGYKDSLDLIKKAEMYYERLRSYNKTTILQVDISQSIKNIIGRLSIDTIWNSPGERAVDSAIQEARSTILARGVGPLEQVPVGDYLEDSVRAKNFITHTQIGPEHRLIAKLVQMKGNKLTPQNSLGGLAESYVETSDAGRVLSTNIPTPGRASSVEASASKYNATLAMRKEIVEKDNKGVDKNLQSSWSVGKPYPDRDVYDKVISDTFNFAIVNMATGVRKAFPAYIQNLNEAVSTSWNSISLINRSEDVYIYQRAERNFNLEFYIFSSTLDGPIEPPEGENFKSVIQIGGKDVGVMSKKMMWNRINFLHGICRPTYTSDGKFDKAPYCKLYVGGLFKGINVIVDSVNIGYDPIVWDINIDPNIGVVPMVALITLSGKFIHDTSPDAYYDFYGDYNE